MFRQCVTVVLTVVTWTFVQAESPVEKPITPEDRGHWSFQPPIRPPGPVVLGQSPIRTPVDAFILAGLNAAGLTPAPPADPQALLRRLYLDLVGLPPTPEEQDAFRANSSPAAYEKVVERLLSSPHYGERWAQHWLDVVRFAESNGYEADGERPHAWRYRDYVAASLNADKPYDRFLTEQIAGDELAAGIDPRTAADLWVATGLHRCGPIHLTSGNVEPEETRREILNETVQSVGAAVLGVTMNCARCHDHKFDPFSQADYYRLEAFFAAAKFSDVTFATTAEMAAHLKVLGDLNQKLTPIRSKVSAIDEPYRKTLRAAKLAALDAATRAAIAIDAKKRTKEQIQLVLESEPLLNVPWDQVLGAMSPEDRTKRTALRAEQHALEARVPSPPGTAWAIENAKKTPPTHLLKRGEWKKKGPAVEPAFPRVMLGAGEQAPATADLRPAILSLTGATAATVPLADAFAPLNRRDLARWVTRPDHPLTARVFMNRVWQHHFGRGLVGTPNDFGLRGEKPTHPELLDYLATEFVANGWHLKPIHRLIVLSNTYRQQSRGAVAERAKTVDEDNRLLWRMNRQRLSGESLRDAILTAAGTLNRQVGGPSVRVPLEPEVYDLIFTEGEPDGLWPVTPDATQHTRRSLYLLAKRNVRLPLLEAFDQPDRLTPCADRAVSTFAPQALILMNGPFAQQQSRAMAATLWKECGPDAESQINRAYRRAFSRPPTAGEVRQAKVFLAEQAETAADRLKDNLPAGVPDGLPAGADLPKAVALADFCLALFNANEFVMGP